MPDYRDSRESGDGLTYAKLDDMAAAEKISPSYVILDEIFIKLPTPPFTPNEKTLVADNVYAHVWQQAMSGGFARAA